MVKKDIIFTGGGSGGHVMPSITLIRALKKEQNYRLSYIGGNGIEKKLIEKEKIPFTLISTGKLRRYISLQNFFDLFKFFYGIFQALEKLLHYNRFETLLFSTGGFVSVPVVIAAKILGFKIFIHEQTAQVGLANKIGSYFADKVFISFKGSKKFFPENKTYYSGYPVRAECYDENLDLAPSFQSQRPIFFATGGGNGSFVINNFIKKNLKFLTKKYFVVHQVGHKFIDEFNILKDDNYLPLEFIGNDIISLFKKSEIILSRAGAGTVSELMAMEKKSIFVPLKISQRNEQFFNAKEAEQKIGSIIIDEDNFSQLDSFSFFKLLNNKKQGDGKEQEKKEKIRPLHFLLFEIKAAFNKNKMSI